MRTILITLGGLMASTSLHAQGGAGCVELFFSEYIEGSSNNKALEIYNPSSGDVDLTTYTVELYANGSATPTNTHALTGMLASQQVIVLANSQADTAILAQADATPAVCTFNGNDALVLKHNGSIIDVIGEVGVNPGASWTVGTGSTQDHTLRRDFSVTFPDAMWSSAQSGWTSFALNDFSDLGMHTSACGSSTGLVSPEVTLSAQVHPLPADALVVLEWPMKTFSDVTLEVLDMQGRMLSSRRMTAPRQVLDVLSLPEGTYVFRMTTWGFPPVTGRFVVAR